MSIQTSKIRHRWEMPLIWLSTVITLVAIAGALLITAVDPATLEGSFGENAASVAETAQSVVLLIFLPISVFIYRFYFAAKAKSNAIRVGPNQFPQLWALYQSLGEKLDMKRLPKLYVTNGNGVVNAYALSCNTRHKYVVMHSETVLAMNDHPEIVEFVLAHELAHHKLGHVSLWRSFIGAIPSVIFPLGVSTTRAQEYSADRMAKTVCCSHHPAMELLVVGPWLHGQVNESAWLDQCEDERREMFVRFANTASSHAVMIKRMKALREIDEHGLSRHGEMF